MTSESNNSLISVGDSDRYRRKKNVDTKYEQKSIDEIEMDDRGAQTTYSNGFKAQNGLLCGLKDIRELFAFDCHLF